MRGYHASTAICRPVNFYHRGSRSLERSKYHPRSSSPPHLSRSPSVHHKFSLRAFSRQLRRFSSRVVPTPSMLLERIRLAKKMEEKKNKNNFCKGCCRPVTERLVSDMQIWRCLPSRNAARVSCIDTRGCWYTLGCYGVDGGHRVIARIRAQLGPRICGEASRMHMHGEAACAPTHAQGGGATLDGK